MTFEPEFEPTKEDIELCRQRVALIGFSEGHDWVRNGTTNFRYCKRCHEPGWEMPATDEETASA